MFFKVLTIPDRFLITLSNVTPVSSILASRYVLKICGAVLFSKDILETLWFYLCMQPGCSREFSGLEFTEAQVVQIKVQSMSLWK